MSNDMSKAGEIANQPMDMDDDERSFNALREKWKMLGEQRMTGVTPTTAAEIAYGCGVQIPDVLFCELGSLISSTDSCAWAVAVGVIGRFIPETRPAVKEWVQNLSHADREYMIARLTDELEVYCEKTIELPYVYRELVNNGYDTVCVGTAHCLDRDRLESVLSLYAMFSSRDCALEHCISYLFKIEGLGSDAVGKLGVDNDHQLLRAVGELCPGAWWGVSPSNESIPAFLKRISKRKER